MSNSKPGQATVVILVAILAPHGWIGG